MDGTPLHLWSPLIWKFKYEFDLDKLKPLIDTLRGHWSVSPESSLLEDGDAISTARVGVYDNYLEPHNSPLLEDYHNWLVQRIAYVWEMNQLLSTSSIITKSWINVHKRGGKTLEHVHNGSDMVVSAYLKCPEGSGNIEFRDPLEYHKLGLPFHPEHQLWREVQVEDNDVLIFPPWMNHRTQENNTDEERIVLTYNVKGT
ncbi:2OG-Fe(II) oxygenase family protein [Synechococcus phage S-CREM1]|nr:2OG-Fe(II) oxygenase family protein [Synechococcus phage S-CREM1]